MSLPPLLQLFHAELLSFEGSYSEAKAFSSRWDERLGFRKSEVEAELLRGASAKRVDEEQAWIGLPLPSLETPYPEILEALQVIGSPREDFVLADLGAAYGRVALVLGLLHPQAKFMGIELREERVQEAQRVWRLLGLDRADLRYGNLAEQKVPHADLYFVYDLGTVERIRAVLRQIQDVARGQSVTVIGRGRATRNVIESEHPWLSQVRSPSHFANLSVYRA